MTTPPPSSEQAALLEVVTGFTQAQIAPRAAADDAAGRFPTELFAALGQMDLLGLPFAQADGGSAQPYCVYLAVLEELARGSLAVAMGVSVHTLATWAIATYAHDAVRAAMMPALTAGRWLGAYALSEAGSGSDAGALRTRAVRAGDSYVLDGEKAWITHGGLADVYVVMARTGAAGSRGISAFAVPADTPGLSFGPPERKMGLHASPTRALRLDAARVPATHLLGEEGQGMSIALSALDGGRLGIAACAVGHAAAALDHAVAYAGQRQQFGQAIGEFQGVGFMLADMATAVAGARALYRWAAALRDASQPVRTAAAMSKLAATDAAMRVCTDAVQVFGGYGYTTDFPVERLLREAKVLQIVEGTNQIQRLVIARGLLACDAAEKRA